MDKLSDWLSYLESIHPKAIDMGLARVQHVANSLQFDWSNCKVITVGGTNGKGTTCRFLEHYLISLGHSVATFRSPHLVDYRERVTLNGKMQEESAYVEAFEAVEHARGDTTLTYFEFGTLAAMVMIQRWQPDVALLEVGLGGRLDATNIVDNDCAVITTIGLDHQAFLGNTRDAIATEKAGIFRSNKPVVIGELDMPAALQQALSAHRGQHAVANQDFHFGPAEQDSWNWQGREHQFTGLPCPEIPMQNASTALAALEVMGFPLEQTRIAVTCQEASLAGRRQVLSQQPLIMIDVAHNPQAAEMLADYIQSMSIKGTLRFVVGMLNDKDIAATLACFADIEAVWYLASTTGPRGCQASQLAQLLPDLRSYTCHPDVTAAYSAATDEALQSDGVFVFGSFLTAADVLAYWAKTH